MIGNYYLKLRHAKNTTDIDSASFYFRKSLRESQQIQESGHALTIESLCMLGEVEFAKDHIDSGLKFFEDALKYKKPQSIQQALLMARLVRNMLLYISDKRTARQLNGKLDIFNENGLVVQLTFNN
jgi:hypothetical protein